MVELANEAQIDSPQHRRRRGMARKAIFTVSRAAPEEIQSFKRKQRAFFLAMVSLGLASLAVTIYLLKSLPSQAVYFVGAGAAFLLLLSVALRYANKTMQFLFFSLGLVGAGAAAGLALMGRDNVFYLLMNPTLLVGLVLLGTIINGSFLGPKKSAAIEFLLIGPWFLVACGLVWLFPAGEWVFAVSGVLGLILSYCLVRASREAPPRFLPGQYLAAAADVIPLACIATYRSFSGGDE